MYGQPMYAPQPVYAPQPMYAPQPVYSPVMAAPMYAPPPPPSQGPMIINLGNNNNNNNGTPCPTCGKETSNIPRKTIGCVTILWCVCLFFFTGGMAWCYPFCVDSCKDIELLCARCQTVKTKIQANCC